MSRLADRSLLTRCEIFVYFGVYIAYIVVGLYKIYVLRDHIAKEAKFQFPAGWNFYPFSQRRRDDSNDELENFGDFIASFWPFYLLHTVVQGFVRWKCPRLQCQGFAAVCALALCLSLDWTSVLLLATVIASYYLVSLARSKHLVWLLSGGWILCINLLQKNEWWTERVGYSEYVLVIVTLSWSVLRGCSYSLSKMGAQEEELQRYNIVQYLGYAMYFPCLTYGPIIGYRRFVDRREEEQQNWLEFAVGIIRSAFWWLVMQCALHYFYIHYMSRDVRMVELMDSVFWQHSAGYFMGQFFFLYYVVTYGLGIAFARQDGIPAPSRPRCIGRIHFYSDMWKYFDEGLYEFLFQHIYAELCGRRSSPAAKFGATALTFAFVFVWHGCYTYVLIWSILNFLCLAAEKLFRALTSLPEYKRITQRYLGTVGAQRLYAMMATQLFIPAAFSNVYFIGGQEIGDFLMRGAYLSGVGNYMALCFCSYCFFQCSELLLAKSDGRLKTKTN
ncbi:protein-cysteine N-palmitoyltransferase Rasp [Drosophila ficusphila]|uniref:protein-cysteine N-palmitoyltransferase Rasp n=1 Tax=Drosophila ficusphila TaxID=30025 RepID=UPI0007E7F873|nr:protein-cysteine N-palmitoyltransferase Rasp [Drosophila ficusphila]